MPRKKKAQPLATTLETLREEIPALQVASELAPPKPFPEQPHEPTFAEKLAASRPQMQPVPEGFRSVAGYPAAGIRVNKSVDRRIAAIQFGEDRLPSRAEKDALQALGEPEDRKFTYRPDTRQWEREATGAFGANIIDAMRLAERLAGGREGPGR